MNKKAAQAGNYSLRINALKQLIREALAEKPGRTVDIADRIGVDVDFDFMEALEQMERAMEINFNWLKGYSL